MARKLLDVLDKSFCVERMELSIKASVGIALFPDHGTDADTLMRRADVAMEIAKKTESGYAMYVAEHDSHTHSRLVLMSDLRRAIERNDQLFLLYQPKINLRTNRMTGVEALVRWQHPAHGLISPDQFIWIAEQTGLIKPLTPWIVQTALGQCRAWHRAGIELSVSVNLSVRNLHDPHLTEEIARLLSTHEVLPGWLELELTESSIMADPEQAPGVLTGLSRMGIRLSIDDFGTGYSSLGYLKKLPVDMIKVDKSFVGGILLNSNDAVIVRSIIELGHNLGLKTVAEGVETQEMWNRLVSLGCDMVQGYYISPPIPAADLTRWLHESPGGWKKIGVREVDPRKIV